MVVGEHVEGSAVLLRSVEGEFTPSTDSNPTHFARCHQGAPISANRAAWHSDVVEGHTGDGTAGTGHRESFVNDGNHLQVADSFPTRWSWRKADLASAADDDAQVSECAGVGIQPAQLASALWTRTRG